MNTEEYPKIFIEATSINILDCTIDLPTQSNVGISANREQVNSKGGYLNNYTTGRFLSNIRDQCASFVQRDSSTELIVDDSDFDVIHINPWKTWKHYGKALFHTIQQIEFYANINPNIKFEIGTQEHVRRYDADEIGSFISDIKFRLRELKNNIIAVIVQTGAIGDFNDKRCKDMITVCDKHKILCKEYVDNLTDHEVTQRFALGIDCLSFGSLIEIETEALMEHISESDKALLYRLCFNSNQWQQFAPENFQYMSDEDKFNLIIRTAAQYVFYEKDMLQMKHKLKTIDTLIKSNIRRWLLSKVELATKN